LGKCVMSYASAVFERLLDDRHKLQLPATLRMMRQYRHTSKIVLMESPLRQPRTLTNTEFLNMPFDKRRIRKGGRATFVQALHSQHGQGLECVIFKHRLLTRSINKIKSVQHDEYLYAGANGLVADKGFLRTGECRRRMALMWITKSGDKNTELNEHQAEVKFNKRLWDFERVAGTNHHLIKNVQFSEYLYAASGHMVSDGSKRARMALMLMNNASGPRVDLTDEARWWDFEPVEGTPFFRIKNVKYGEYLYGPGDEVLADKGLTWSFSKTKGQRRIAAMETEWTFDLDDQSKWWEFEMVDDFENGEER